MAAAFGPAVHFASNGKIAASANVRPPPLLDEKDMAEIAVRVRTNIPVCRPRTIPDRFQNEKSARLVPGRFAVEEKARNPFSGPAVLLSRP